MKRFIPWIGAAAIIILFFGTTYTMVQQAQRSDANYPQIQLAEDAAAALDAGTLPQNVVSGKVNIDRSLAPFVVIYGKSGTPIAGSGQLDNHLPVAPKGILTAAAGQEYHAVSWQPQAGVRIAAVTVAADKYYVLSGRSIKEVEKNESQAMLIASIGELGALAVLLILYLTTGRRTHK